MNKRRSDAMDHIDELLAIERQLWRNDPHVYAATLLPDAILIFPGIGRITLDTAVEAIRGENEAGRRWDDVTFSAERGGEIAPDVCLLSYHADARWSDGTMESADCLTVYVRRDGRWRVAAHQQTDAR
jgi:hypothetical protein